MIVIVRFLKFDCKGNAIFFCKQIFLLQYFLLYLSMKNFTLSFGTYPFEFEVFVGDHEAFRSHLLSKEFNKEEVDSALYEIEGTNALTIEFSGGYYFLWLHSYENNTWNNSIIAHECFHLVEMLFGNIGIKHHRKYSSEAYAYELGHLFEKVVNALNE